MSLPSAVRQLCCYSYSLHSFQVFISRPLYFCCNVHLSHKSFCLFFFFFKKTFISKYFHKDFQHHIAVSSQIFKWFHLRINVIFNCIMNSACSVKYLNTQQLQKLADPFFFFSYHQKNSNNYDKLIKWAQAQAALYKLHVPKPVWQTSVPRDSTKAFHCLQLWCHINTRQYTFFWMQYI